MHELHNFAMLTGAALLAKVKELGRCEQIRPGPSLRLRLRPKKDGSERLNFTAFYEALLNAKGLDFSRSPRGRKGGRKLSFSTKDAVQRQPHGRQGLHSHARASSPVMNSKSNWAAR
jgi:hypothetical protein